MKEFFILSCAKLNERKKRTLLISFPLIIGTNCVQTRFCNCHRSDTNQKRATLLFMLLLILKRYYSLFKTSILLYCFQHFFDRKTGNVYTLKSKSFKLCLLTLTIQECCSSFQKLYRIPFIHTLCDMFTIQIRVW